MRADLRNNYLNLQFRKLHRKLVRLIGVERDRDWEEEGEVLELQLLRACSSPQGMPALRPCRLRGQDRVKTLLRRVLQSGDEFELRRHLQYLRIFLR